ncbi:hypothetical protein JD969_13300 [Planctomycetota bacterium]|nr:hypothetical protein JD969_13300 [Planctomycetota bacterium]
MKDMQELIAKLHSSYKQMPPYKFRKSEYAQEIDIELTQPYLKLTDYYKSTTNSDRQAIRQLVSQQDCSYIGFCSLAFNQAKDTNNHNIIYLAILAHSICDFSPDMRDNVLQLQAMEPKIITLNINPHTLYRQAAEISGEYGAKKFRELIRGVISCS